MDIKINLIKKLKYWSTFARSRSFNGMEQKTQKQEKKYGEFNAK